MNEYYYSAPRTAEGKANKLDANGNISEDDAMKLHLTPTDRKGVYMSKDGVYRVTFSKSDDDLEISAASITAYTQTEREAVIDKAEAVAEYFKRDEDPQPLVDGGRRRRRKTRKVKKSKKSKRKGTTRRR